MDVQSVNATGLKSLVTVHCGDSLGSGFAYGVDDAPHGYTTAIITNQHVIAECTSTNGPDAKVVQNDVTLKTVLWTWDEANDLALLWVAATLPTIGDAAEPVIGDPVVALG